MRTKIEDWFWTFIATLVIVSMSLVVGFIVCALAIWVVRR